MPREGAIIFSDLIDKLVVLRIECPKCDRPGQYQPADLIRAVPSQQVRLCADL
jgi:hypothetical protein